MRDWITATAAVAGVAATSPAVDNATTIDAGRNPDPPAEAF